MNLTKISKITQFIGGFLRYNIFSNFVILKPKNLVINITYLCNSKCIMCNIWKLKPKKELSFIQWKKVIKDPIFLNIENLTISGGESFLYKGFSKTIKLFIDSMPKLKRLVINTNGFQTESIISNLIPISKYCYSKKIALSITLSIDGLNKEHDQIRNTQNAFKKATNTLTQLKNLSAKNNFKICVACVLMNRNINKYFAMKKWLKKQRVNFSFQLIGFHETYINNLKTEKDLNFNQKNKPILLKVLTNLKKEKNFLNFNSYYWNDMFEFYKNKKRRQTPCPFLKDDFVIDSIGDIYYCLSVRPIGNFIKEKRSISDIYFDPKNINFRKSLWNKDCKFCNSACDSQKAIAYDFKNFLFYYLFNKIRNIFLL